MTLPIVVRCVRRFAARVSVALAALVASAMTAQGQAVPAVPAVPAATRSGLPNDVVLQRETFSYTSGGRRDPYRSLMSSREVRPLVSDLRVTVIVFDSAGEQSVAILRDAFSKRQYRVRVGQQVGRLRVSAIKPKAVQFTIEEFGFNRTETLPLSSDSTKVRTP